MTATKRKSKLKAEQAIQKIASSHHIDSVVEQIVGAMGGPKELARIFKLEFDLAPPGSPVKARMLDALLQILESRSKDDNEASLDLLDDEDLRRVASELMEEDVEDAERE